VLVLSQAGSGTVDPVRKIAGLNTGLYKPFRIARSGNELYIINTAEDDGHTFVQVFPIDASGDVNPNCTIDGPSLLSLSDIALS
jgi:hypothetical protein